MTDKIKPTQAIDCKKLISVMVNSAIANGLKYVLESFDNKTREQAVGEIRIEIKRTEKGEISNSEGVARIFEVIAKYLKGDLNEDLDKSGQG